MKRVSINELHAVLPIHVRCVKMRGGVAEVDERKEKIPE